MNALFKKDAYSPLDKDEMKSLLVELDIYFVNEQGAVRRRETSSPRWAWLRKNRGGFDRQPEVGNPQRHETSIRREPDCHPSRGCGTFRLSARPP